MFHRDFQADLLASRNIEKTKWLSADNNPHVCELVRRVVRLHKCGTDSRFEGVRPGAEWFRERGQWQGQGYVPRPGDIIFFDWENDGLADHMGIVKCCENGVVLTIEGNSGDACRENSYLVGGTVIYGYGVPLF